MNHVERVHIPPVSDTERYVAFYDKEINLFNHAVGNLGSLTLSKFLKAACFFRLPKNAYATVDVYQTVTETDPKTGKPTAMEHNFDYVVYNSQDTMSPADEPPDFGRQDEEEPAENVEIGKCYADCGGVQKSGPCPDPENTHGTCVPNPPFGCRVDCEDDDAPDG